ncbi:hypothetical protein H109_02863 [Trichophyton interdigitale MR816]|uniref:Uncharacterized protein n=1 Tax=Trichophyton interdigitale (strain MR816) TaxID=1215338 RepID=A0A059JBS7_TRIIM|nr:hypothetical protein H109_02863 [Trichophyton interdigitale MR816]
MEMQIWEVHIRSHYRFMMKDISGLHSSIKDKKLRFNISINYIEDSDHAIPRRGEKRGFSSTTQRMFSEWEAQINAENASGQPSIWRDVYKLIRCPGPPCDGRYCWQDPVGKKHYKLRTYYLKQLIKHVEQGGILETHD